MSGIRIVPVAPAHRAAWDGLYAAYAAFYRIDQTAEMRDLVWSWLMDPGAEIEGLIAEDASGTPIGLAHYRAFLRPLMAQPAGFLDDLFVSPASRGSGAAPALLAQLRQIGRARGWATIRWITADDNYRGRTLYDRHAKRTPWITYDMPTTEAASAPSVPSS